MTLSSALSGPKKNDITISKYYSYVSSLLCGDTHEWRPDLDEQAFIAFIDEHGVSCLVHRALSRAGAFGAWPEALRAFLERESRFFGFQSVLRKHEIERVLTLFKNAGISPILLKGFPLSYTLYPEPYLRPGYDIDILIRHDRLETARKILGDAGYRFPNAVSGEYVSHECTAKRVDERGVEHALDLHWKIANPLIFSELFSFDELSAAARELTAVRGGRTVTDATAFVYACIHRVAHHHDSDRLLWLMDIDLLARGFDDSGWAEVLRIASAKQVRGVCLRGLERAQAAFRTPIPEPVRAALSEGAGTEPAAPFLEGAAPRVTDIRSNLRTLKRPGEKLRYLRELAFPPADYMLAKYGRPNKLFLPLLYAARAASGLRKLFAR